MAVAQFICLIFISVFQETASVCCEYMTVYINKTTDPTYAGVTFDATISENLAIGSSVMSAAATDVDAGDTLTYSVLTANTYFTADTSGIIRTITNLPLSSGPGYSTIQLVEVKAVDTCMNSATGTFSVTSTNAAPSFSNLPSTYTLTENVTTATSLLEVSVSDHPSTATLCCSLTRSNPSTSYFELRSSGGTHTLWLKDGSSLEHDTVSAYYLFICCDDGVLSSTSYLNVIISSTDPKITVENPSFVIIGLIVCLIPVGILFGLSCALMIVTIYIR